MMQEILKVLQQHTSVLNEVKKYVEGLQKSRADVFKETWIDGQDVCIALNISQRSLQTLRSSGLMPFSQFHGKCYYKVSDLEALLESNYTRNRQSKCHDQ